MDYKKYIRMIEDYPIPGIHFRDITTLVENGPVFHKAVKELSEFARVVGADVIVGPEARGFIIGTPIAYELEVGFVPIRKPGKLPGAVVKSEYEKEYGTDVLEVHVGSIQPGSKVLIADDLLATGGTLKAMIELLKGLKAEIVGAAFLIDLVDLHAPDLLGDIPVKKLMDYEGD
ncbi:MAG: adenine phosphoribosyltransferase [Lactobacillales bacterium]|jgi:adenine phosphoribosyltransferase|nr:adenine phosphoribosyltransferase [Lactobacillales bacterium]